MIDPLYTIIDVSLCRERRVEPLALLDAFLAGGARLVQLRDKTPSSAERLALADAAVARTRAAGAMLIVNDRADLAAMAGADGGHVGEKDLAGSGGRAIFGGSGLLGGSAPRR